MYLLPLCAVGMPCAHDGAPMCKEEDSEQRKAYSSIKPIKKPLKWKKKKKTILWGQFFLSPILSFRELDMAGQAPLVRECYTMSYH